MYGFGKRNTLGAMLSIIRRCVYTPQSIIIFLLRPLTTVRSADSLSYDVSSAFLSARSKYSVAKAIAEYVGFHMTPLGP